MATDPLVPERRIVDRGAPDRRRRGPRPRPTPTIEAMQRAAGTPVRPADLAVLTGLSKAKVLADIRNGYLAADQVRCGHAFMWIVQYREAQRYLRTLGVLD